MHAPVARIKGQFSTVALVSLLACIPMAGDSSGAASESPIPGGWVAYSSYGIQLAVPPSWSVRDFQNCPGAGPGTLLIGAPLVESSCAAIATNANIVSLVEAASEGQATPKGQGTHAVLHGLRVIRISEHGQTLWEFPSYDAVVVATGPATGAVARTLGPATPGARAAAGLLVGTEQLLAMETVNVTGPIALVRLDAHGPALPPLRAIDGQFSAQLPPGRYQLQGQDGNAPCPGRLVRITSGEVTRITISCQGE